MKWIAGSAVVWTLLSMAGCGGGGGAVSSAGSTSSGCTGQCANADTFLTVNDVQIILAQGIAEAQARHVAATIAVVDRVGNVLGVFRMGSAGSRPVLISSAIDASANPVLHTGLDGIRLPAPDLPLFNLDDQAAIAKAVTGAYLSSEGNAFSTRTASQIIQEHFNVGDANTPSGPLFGVQFSQFACSDFMQRATGGTPGTGPHNSPLGLSADPGGFPLYKSGTVVGGLGVIADGYYSLDKDITAPDMNTDDEAIAYAASYSYLAPVDRRADEITANGVTLRYSDVDASDLRSTPGSAPALDSLDASVGRLLTVTGYADGELHAGTAYGQAASGVRADTSGNFPGLDAFVFVDAANAARYPPKAGTDGANALSQQEVTQILASGLQVAESARAQIRLPDGLSAQVTIAVVDTQGVILGMVRTRDAPLFGSDVSIQKARSAAFLSSAVAGAFLQGLPNASYLATDGSGYPQFDGTQVSVTSISLAAYVPAAQSFLQRPALLTDGSVAFTARALGNLARPFFPDDIDGAPPGPFSKPQGQWSVFSTGLQLDLSINAVLQHVLYVASAGTKPRVDVGSGCAGVNLPATLAASPTVTTPILANGLQIFPGSVPIYRNGILVGAVGVSGDGVDQDDMIAFLGLQRASTALSGTVGQAINNIRADTLTPMGTRLLYVQCPQSPFLNSSAENVCAGF